MREQPQKELYSRWNHKLPYGMSINRKHTSTINPSIKRLDCVCAMRGIAPQYLILIIVEDGSLYYTTEFPPHAHKSLGYISSKSEHKLMPIPNLAYSLAMLFINDIQRPEHNGQTCISYPLVFPKPYLLPILYYPIDAHMGSLSCPEDPFPKRG